MDYLQKLIHQLEVGGGMRYFRWGALVLTLAIVTLLYDAALFKNMATPEAMDAAQVGRNLAQGKGYTTYFIRPLSLSLVKEHNREKLGLPALGQQRDDARLSGNHPDLANAPVYPVVLAGLMKVLPFHYDLDANHFWRAQPEFLIALFNQVLFFAVVVLVFFLARRLFDAPTAWLTALLLFGSELLWRFSVSGLPTMLLVLQFTGLLWCVLWLEEELREPKGGRTRLWLLAAAAGALVGLGALTRYSFGWLLLPVLAFVLLYSGKQRLVLAATALGAFLLVFTPWVARNYAVSGTPFGTAGYAVVENTPIAPGPLVERSLQPNFGPTLLIVRYKLISNLRTLVQNELPRLGGTWVAGFFLAGLLLSFTSPAVRRLRTFLLMCLGVLMFVQALGRTQLTEDSPEVNSENLLVLLVPLVLVYGVSLFYLLLDQIEFRFRQLRLAAVSLFAALACLPLLLQMVPVMLMLLHFQLPNGDPRVYAPYDPPFIQEAGRWSQTNGLIMSDMPWAVAWYGQAQSVWLTLRVAPNLRDLKPGANQPPSAPEDFFSINQEKPIDALLLSQVTLSKLDSRALTPAFLGDQQNWGSLSFQAMLSYRIDPRLSRPGSIRVTLPVYKTLLPYYPLLGAVAPESLAPDSVFPLHYWQPAHWPDFLLLTASETHR